MLYHATFQRQSVGAALLDETYKRLDLVEKDYFGLLYTDSESGLAVSYSIFIIQIHEATLVLHALLRLC